jgi:hypothetical protein
MGGLGDLLKGPLGGILAGASAGSVVNGGLSDLLNQFRQSGHGDVAGSWVGNGPNRPISPADLSKALGTDQISTLMSQSGLSRDELLTGRTSCLDSLITSRRMGACRPTKKCRAWFERGGSPRLWGLKDREAECSPPRLTEETVTGPVTMGQSHAGECSMSPELCPLARTGGSAGVSAGQFTDCICW